MFTDEDKKTIMDASNEGLQWLQGNENADADVIEGKQKEIEAKINPIMSRIYQQGADDVRNQPESEGAPQAEEVDLD